jgi:ketosteroid isomerase-like protein
MTGGHAELVRSGYEAFNRRDVEAAVADLDPDVVWWPSADEPVTEPSRGHTGFRERIDSMLELSPDIHVEIEELFEAGDLVVACLRYSGRGRGSGAPLEIGETHVVRVRDGKIVEVREYRHRSQALEAAGLQR